MNKNTRSALVTLMLIVCLLVVAYLLVDMLQVRGQKVDCGAPEGVHHTIDMRNFNARYSGYSLSVEAEIRDQAKISGKLSESPLQQLSDSLQHVIEYQKAIVAGFNSCAVTKEQYGKLVLQFGNMDALARQISGLINKPSLSEAERNSLENVTRQYIELSKTLGK